MRLSHHMSYPEGHSIMFFFQFQNLFSLFLIIKWRSQTESDFSPILKPCQVSPFLGFKFQGQYYFDKM